MFLKSIEVQGFKSFANRMTFEFNKGITAIVGPNGSGKSNVADAVRWVLGEQSAKQLRSTRMEDVIFSGTESRKALGFAYVAITLDNSDHKLSVDYDTVTVSRRVYRSGESEYRINGHICRLKDIQEMFFDTGIGKEGYSIIGQGQIDKILSGKPEDRRELFDEAAGIVKFKRRKALTEKNLVAEQQNLDRVKDILHELEKQIGPLARQSETAREYLKLRDQLKSFDANIYLVSFDQLKLEVLEFEKKLDIINAQLKEAKDDYDSSKEAYYIIEEKLAGFDDNIAKNQNKCNEYALLKERYEGEHALILSQKAALNDKEDTITGQLDKAMASHEEYESQLKEHLESDRELSDLHAKIFDEQNEVQNLCSKLENELANVKEAIDFVNAEIIEDLNESSAINGRIERYKAMREQAEIRKSQLHKSLIETETSTDTEEKLCNFLKDELEGISVRITDINKEQDRYQKALKQLTRDINDAESKLVSNEKSFHEESSKYNTLKNISERYDGYGGSIRRVMEKKADYPGVVGVVADIIHVKKDYETAIETALASSISNVVTEDENTAKSMIAYLKNNRLGRATFLPLTSIKGRKAENAARISMEKGVLGLGCELVDYESRFASIIDYLLGRVFVVDNIDNALALARKYSYKLRIVTLEGESLSPGGSLSGGAYKNSSNLLGRRRELDELKLLVQRLKANAEKLRTRVSELKKEMTGFNALATENEKELAKFHLQQNTVKLRLSQVEESKRDHVKSVDGINHEIDELNLQLQKLEGLCAELNSQKALLEDKKLQNEGKLEALSAQSEQFSEQLKEFNEQEAKIRVQYAGINGQHQFNQENIERIKSQLVANSDRMAGYKTELEEISGSKTKLTQKLNINIEESAKLVEKIEGLREILDDLNIERAKLATEHRDALSKREELSVTMAELDKEQFRLNHQKERLEESRTQLSNYMWEEYSLTYVGAKALEDFELKQYSLNRLKKSASQIKMQIKGLGAVNVNAIEEYKQVSERYENMKNQHDDLVLAEEKLTGIIESLNDSMKRQFREKFAQIQKEFKTVFARLFGGGDGTLALSDPDNILETGIIITAQPPGKKLQNMMQLSGGEKALTAIALLFAIQSLKPSPFCLLDEIEAALDDANVKRFAEYLNNLTNETQFIVITHRRGTMTAADVLYGITMQEKGISTLVSVSLIEDKLSK